MHVFSWVCWCTPAVPALWEMRREDEEFKLKQDQTNQQTNKYISKRPWSVALFKDPEFSLQSWNE